MNPRLFTSLVFGASLLSQVASAEAPAPAIATFVLHNDMHAGALWKNDRARNNDTLGTGAEHVKITQLPGGRILVVGTASYTDVVPLVAGAGFSSADANVLPPKDGDPGVEPQGTRVQALCAAYQLDANQGLVKVNMAYITNNDSPDWQNGNKPTISPINGGTAAVVFFGYDPNGNRTRIYGRVIGPSCELLSQQTQLFADNNDDYGGLYDTGDDGTVADSGGVTRSCIGWIGNGNATDDARFGCVTAKATGKTGPDAYTLTPDFKISIEPREQRSRGYLQKTTIPNTMLFAVAEGDDAPPDHIRVGLVNTAPDTPDDQRLIFRQRVATRQGNIHYTTPSLVPITDAAGKVTDRYILSYVKVDTTNRNGRTKGKTSIQTVPIELSPTGVKLLDTPKENLFGLGDNSHPGMSAAVYGLDARPVAFMFSSNVTDGGTANVKVIGLTPTGTVESIRALNWGDASAGGWFSQHYGPNPNTPQGRTYAPTSVVVANPGYGTGYQASVKNFLVVANVHHMIHAGECGSGDPNKGTNNGTCGGKNAMSLVLVPVVADAPKGDPTNPDDPTPVDPTGPVASDPGATLGGCATTGGEGAGGMVLLGLAAVLVRRRRSH